jgi:cytochrome c peroxidase
MATKHPSDGPWRRVRPCLLGGTLTAAALVGGHGIALGEPPGTTPAPDTPGPSHGALAMDRQEAMLAGWLGASPTASAPPGVAPSFWRWLLPHDNLPAEARIALGRKLYFDPRLSRDGTVACATCHDASRGFTDRRSTSEGIRDQVGKRNAPTTVNAVFFSSQFWDGRAASLEEQATLPIVNPIEMGQPDGNAAAAALSGDAEYRKAFQAAYGRAVNYQDIGRAIASFERTLVFIDAPFDRFAGGDASAISDEARAGWALFNGKARCVACHQLSASSPVGTDSRFHNVGVSARHEEFEKLANKAVEVLAKDSSKEELDRLALETDVSELGRFVVTRNPSDIGAFKTSQVRNVGITAPYMHDGSMATLWDVIDHYNKGGEANPYLDGGIEPLNLSEAEVDDLVAFLFTLTDDRFADANRAEMERQRQLAAQRRPFRDTDGASRKVLPFERRATGQR